MEHDGVGDVEVDVTSLSDGELAQKLRQLGANIGPITGMCKYFALFYFTFSVFLTDVGYI